jgi:hypothetical protein
MNRLGVHCAVVSFAVRGFTDVNQAPAREQRKAAPGNRGIHHPITPRWTSYKGVLHIL